MKLYFCNSRNQMRVIAEIAPEPTTRDEIYSAAMKEIRKFCSDRNFHIYYVRTWAEERDGVNMTVFDVGSHTEFFYADRVAE